MVFALAGDSTTTTSVIRSMSLVGQQCNAVFRQRADAAGALQFQQGRHEGGGRELAATHRIVNLGGGRTRQPGRPRTEPSQVRFRSGGFARSGAKPASDAPAPSKSVLSSDACARSLSGLATVSIAPLRSARAARAGPERWAGDGDLRPPRVSAASIVIPVPASHADSTQGDMMRRPGDVPSPAAGDGVPGPWFQGGRGWRCVSAPPSRIVGLNGSRNAVSGVRSRARSGPPGNAQRPATGTGRRRFPGHASASGVPAVRRTARPSLTAAR